MILLIHFTFRCDKGLKARNVKLRCPANPGFETHPEIYKGLELAAKTGDAGHEVVKLIRLISETAMAGYKL